MSEEVSSNQRAFLKISEELRRVDNSIVAVEILSKVINLQGWARQQLEDIKEGAVYTEEVQQLIPLALLVSGGPENFSKLKDKLIRRHKELVELSDAYLCGKDIVASKLASDRGSRA